MALPILKSSSTDLMLLQNKWTPQLNPVLAQPIVNGLQLTNLSLSTGVNVINHLLGRNYQGYFITGMRGAFVQIYDTPSPMPSLTLVLHASAPGSIDLFVY